MCRLFWRPMTRLSKFCFLQQAENREDVVEAIGNEEKQVQDSPDCPCNMRLVINIPMPFFAFVYAICQETQPEDPRRNWDRQKYKIYAFRWVEEYKSK